MPLCIGRLAIPSIRSHAQTKNRTRQLMADNAAIKSDLWQLRSNERRKHWKNIKFCPLSINCQKCDPSMSQRSQSQGLLFESVLNNVFVIVSVFGFVLFAGQWSIVVSRLLITLMSQLVTHKSLGLLSCSVFKSV